MDFEATMSPAVANGSDRAILLVDDEPRVLRALGRTLGREPYAVLRAAGGLEALDLLEVSPVKVVVADQRMPGMSGSELLGEIRRRWPLVGRVILTGYPGQDIMVRSLEAEVDVLMTKPWNDEKLRRAIRRLIDAVDKGRASSWDGSPEPWSDWGGEGG
jgi:CheY-like chemotaxis protein